MKHALCLILVAVLGLSSFALGEAQSYTLVEDYYEVMLFDFEAGMFDMVLETYAAMVEEFADGAYYRDANSYAKYAEGILALNEGDLGAALTNFKILRDMNEAFPEEYKQLNTSGSLANYVEGRVREEAQEYVLAVESYKLAGGCRDSLDRIERLNELIEGISRLPKRVTIQEINCTINSIELKWADSEASASYAVSCSPSGGKSVYAGSVTECALFVDSLLPNTSYTFQITIDDTGDTFLCSAATQPAPALSGDLMLSAKTQLFYCSAADVQRYGGIVRALSRKLAVYPENTGAGFPIQADRGRAIGLNNYYINLKLNNVSGRELTKQLEWMFILRLEDNGTYSATGMMDPPGKSSLVATNYAMDLSMLMEAAYAGLGEWKAAQGKLELYINGMFTDEIDVQIVI